MSNPKTPYSKSKAIFYIILDGVIILFINLLVVNAGPAQVGRIALLAVFIVSSIMLWRRTKT